MLSMVSKVLPGVLLLSLLNACSPSDSRSNEYEFRFIEENGITVSLTTGGPKYQQPLFRYEEEVVLQQDPGVPESLLSGRGFISVGDDGSFYVIDWNECRVIVFDQEGRYQRSFGGKGQGPGEFMHRMSLVEHDGGVLTLWDSSLLRTTRFHEDGTLLGIENMSRGWRSSQNRQALPDGSTLTVIAPGFGHESIDREYYYAWKRAVITGTTGDTIADFRTERVKSDFLVWVSNDPSSPGPYGRIMEYNPSPEIIYLSDEEMIVSGTGWTPEIIFRDLTGTVRRIFRLSLEPEPITRRMKAGIRAVYEEEWKRAGPSPYVRAERKALKFHDRKTFWGGMGIDDAGWFWLYVPEFESDVRESEGHLYRVLSPDGEYLGNSRRMGGWRGRVVRGRYTIVMVDPVTGEPVATIYRIVPAVEGLTYP